MNPLGIDANVSVAHRSSRQLRLMHLQRYALAVLSVGFALAMSLIVGYFHFRVPAAFLLLFAVAVSSWYGGTGPGVLAAALSIISFYWFFVEPIRTIYIYPSEIPFFIIFVTFAALLSWFGVIRRRVEKGLREQADLLNLTHDSVFVMNMKGVIKYWNRGAEEQYGWTAEQAVGKVVHDLLKTVFPGSLEELKAEVTRTGRWEGELVHTRRDGTKLVAASRWALQRDKRGALLAILEVNNDITERKRAEEALRRSKAYLSEAQRLTHTGAWVINVTGQPVYWSEELFRIWGFDPQRGLPTRDQAVQRIHPEDLDKYWQFWQSVMRPNQEKVDLGLEFRIVLPDGTAKHLYGVAHPVLNANGELVEVVGTTMDITERKRAEEALRLYSAYNRSLIEASVDPLVTIGPDGKITDVNAATELATGCSRGELIGTDFCDYFTEPGSAHVGYERAFREGVVRDYPLELQHRDGRVMSVLYNASVYRDQSDQVIGIFAAARDITERKRAEETLRRTEAYLAEAQRLSHTGSWAFDVAKGKYIYVSEECSRIFELDAQEDFPAREAVSRLIHAEDWDRVNRDFEKSVHEKVDTSSEFRIVLPSGTTRHVQAIRHPVLNDAGDVVQVVGTVVDITERKAAEAALRESETRFRTFVDHAGDAFFMLDFADGTIVDLNQSACDSLGYTRGELIGMTPLAFDVNLDRATLESVAEQTATGEPVLFDRHSHRRKDGSLFPVEVHASVFWHGGRRFLLNVARDISDRVRADEERERLRQLEADLAHINRVSMMGELAASIAHEVNQPLSGIASNANASLRFLAGDSPNLEEARAALRDIVRDGKRAGEIIARIRALTKRTAAAREKLDLNETIREVLALVGDEARRSSVIVRTQFADDLSPVAGDRVQLQQVVLNLVMNAIEAMSGIRERPRELLITTRNIDADHVQVTVEDSGIGLGPTTMDKIFDSFYTTKPGGMGMGLSIGRSILQAHGGQLWATAKDSPGTMFHFTVPKYHEEGAHAAATGT